MANFIGFISTICICITLVPQIIKIVKTKDVAGLALSTYVIYDVGNAAGLIYGVAIASAPVIVTSVVTLLASMAVTTLIFVWGKRPSRTTATQ